MPGGHIIPWTSVGSTPCCCEDPCPTSLLEFMLSAFYNTNDYSRAILTPELYAGIKNGTVELTATINTTISGSTFGIGDVGSYFPSPLGATMTTTFPLTALNYVGFGPTRCVQNFNTRLNGFLPELIFLYNTSGTFYVNRGYLSMAFHAVLQDVGQGIGADYPLTQPAIYFIGALSQIVGAANENYVTYFGNGTGSGTAFGQSIPLKVTKVGGLIVDTTFTMEVAAP